MNSFDQKKRELEFRAFANRHFERPSDCRNADQIRFYVQELCQKISEYENRFNQAPAYAYVLLAQYNLAHNQLVHREFVSSYC
jgi:hypothetical protein